MGCLVSSGGPGHNQLRNKQAPAGSTGGAWVVFSGDRATAERPPEVLKRCIWAEGSWGGETLTRVLQAPLSRRPRNSEVPTGEPEGRPGPDRRKG